MAASQEFGALRMKDQSQTGTVYDKRDGKYEDYTCHEPTLTRLKRLFGIAFTAKVQAMVD